MCWKYPCKVSVYWVHLHTTVTKKILEFKNKEEKLELSATYPGNKETCQIWMHSC